MLNRASIASWEERVNEKYDKSGESKSKTMLLTIKQLLSDDA